MTKFKPTYLYIKTHNVTGLKYFGKTVSKDPYSYKGSGVYWRRHIKNHGYDVTTEILGFYTDRDECLKAALDFSIKNNIVESKEWANLINETLDGGGVSSFKDLPKETQEKILEGSKKGGITCRDNGIGIFGMSEDGRLKATINSKKRMKEIYGVNSFFSILNKDKDFNEKKKGIFKLIKHQQGEKNSQYGTCWISYLEFEITKRIKKEFYPEYYEQGWVIGRSKWNSLRYHKVKKTKSSRHPKVKEEIKRLWEIFIEGDYKSITEFKELINYPYSVHNIRCLFDKYIQEYKYIKNGRQSISSELVREFYKENEELN